MSFVRVASLLAAGACVLPMSTNAFGSEIDDLVGQMSSVQQDAFLTGMSESGVVLPDGQTLEEAVQQSLGMSETIIHSQWWAGSQLPLGTTEPNNATWVLNAPNGLAGVRTEVSATIVHGGFLNQPVGATGWDHLAILTRGTNLESSLSYIGYPSSTPHLFFYGEGLGSGPTVNSIARGRGPTFWAKGTSFCGAANTTQPCMILENYTVNLSGPGLITEAPIVLPVSDAPFDVFIETTQNNIEVFVWQGGQLKASINCQQARPGDHRCGTQPGDTVRGDVMFAHIIHTVPAAHAHRPVGVLNPSVTLYGLRPQAPCPRCPIP